MIAAGEAGGILDTILKRLATYIEKAVKLSGQVKSAMIYPVAIVIIAGLVVGVILWKVIPTFAALFSGLGADLPLPTRVVIALSNNLVRFFPFLFIGAGAAVVRVQDLLRDRRTGGAMIDAITPEAAGARQHHAQDRGRAVLPDAVHADQLGRADSRRPRNHREDGRQRDRRGRDHGDAQEHRARRNDLGAAEGDQGVPADGDADDWRRRGDRRARHDARRRSRTSTRKRSTPPWPGC